MQPQPPPNAPAPPPSQEARRSRKGWFWICVVGIFSMMGLIFLAPLTTRSGHGRGHDLTEAVNNARQIGIALFEFDADYGAFPNSTTAPAVVAETGSLLPLGSTSSNDYFRQLIAGNYTQSEKMFWARIDGAHKPDDVVTGRDALKKGECGFTYFLGALAKTDNPLRPLAVTPKIPGTDRFDPKPFDGRAVVLRMDNSATMVPIDKDDHVMIDGKNMMSPSHPIWNGHPPSIAWPDL